MTEVEQKKGKIIGIGFHKTGTTSLAMAMSILGYKNCRGMSVLKKKYGLNKCIEKLNMNDYALFYESLIPYQSCQDNPWYILYKELDVAFPGSKFILTTRDEKRWLKSCENFFKSDEKLIHEWVYGVNKFPGNEGLYLERYRRHNIEVEDYFKDRPNDLLIVNWEQGSGWNELCTFLSIPTLDLPFPHINKGIDKNSNYIY